VTSPTDKGVFSSSMPRQAAFIAYINGIEVPAKSVSMRYGVWQIPEMQVEMVADPVLVRLGSEDRIQVAVFYLDDCDVAPGVEPAFRLFGEGEITGWGYRNTSSNRSIVFTVVNQIAIWTQLFVQFMTTLDDMIGHSTDQSNTSKFSNPSSELVYPYSLFNQGLLPGVGSAPNTIKRPFDYLYNTVKGMIASIVPDNTRTIPAANFFTRWARMTNFHNRFAASPFFDEVENDNIFPVLKALQNTSAIDVITKKLLPNIQNAGSFFDMLQMVYSTMLMEVAMIPGMPLVTVNLQSGLVQTTNFAEHRLVYDPARVGPPAWIPVLADHSRKLNPKRLQNYFVKPQMLFGVPPSCNVMFPSQVLTVAYDENFVTQPTRLYFNDEVLTKIIGAPQNGVTETIMNALNVAYPPAADAFAHEKNTNFPKFNGKNFLLWPEEFYKGPVMDRRTVPPWLFLLQQAQMKGAAPGATNSTSKADSAAATPNPPAQTGTRTPPAPEIPPSGRIMVHQSANGFVQANGVRKYRDMTESLRTRARRAIQGTSLDLEYVLCWINLESGGNSHSTDGDHAKGIFQLIPEECARLRSKNFPQGVNPADLVSNPPSDIAWQSGIDYILNARKVADALAKEVGLSWTEADMWRLTKFRSHGLPAYAKAALPRSKVILGHAPVNWEEFYFAVFPEANNLKKKALGNATAMGVVLGASGTMQSTNSETDRRPFSAGAAVGPPATPPDVSSAPTVAPASPTVTPVEPAQHDVYVAANEDVYHLYAKFEYFRERYAKRTGSATVAWNPYVVPGFPGVVFDQRASRVDLVVYITTVQHSMAHSGQRGTTLSFMYGRQFQEMFDLMALEFKQNDATARGTAPQEPLRDISKISQSFLQAESYYQRLFYGGQSLYGKDASFDFRKVVAYAPDDPSGEPVPIFVDGPDVASGDERDAAQQQYAILSKQRSEVSATLLDQEAQLAAAEKTLAALTVTQQTSADPAGNVATVMQGARDSAQATIGSTSASIFWLKTQLILINNRLNIAIATLEKTDATTTVTRVDHNLSGARELVPAPAFAAAFESRDVAMRYNWRPICTLDEYIVFYGTAGEGAIPAFGHPQSVGARYFGRIRHMTAPPTTDFVPPAGADGLAGRNVPGLDTESFPQTRANWDVALEAYKKNVINVKAPRT
jgi:hypothetical protein